METSGGVAVTFTFGRNPVVKRGGSVWGGPVVHGHARGVPVDESAELFELKYTSTQPKRRPILQSATWTLPGAGITTTFE